MKNRLVFVVVLLFSFAYPTASQLKKGSLGLTTSILESPNLGMAYAASENMRLAVFLGFSSSKDSIGRTSTFHVGTSLWRYMSASDGLATFAGGSIGVDTRSTPDVTSSSLGITGLYGAEYWFSPQFSAHGLLQLHFVTGKDAGASISTFFTSAQTGVTWYF